MTKETAQKNVELFGKYVGMELKGAMAANGWTASKVSQEIGRDTASMSMWLNNKRDITIQTLYQICALIEVAPETIIRRAAERLQKN